MIEKVSVIYVFVFCQLWLWWYWVNINLLSLLGWMSVFNINFNNFGVVQDYGDYGSFDVIFCNNV